MKIQVNNETVFELNETQKKVIKNEILESEFDEDMKRRARYIIEHKYQRCLERLKREWEPKLVERGVRSLPTSSDEFALLVFSQPDYKDRTARELEDALQV